MKNQNIIYFCKSHEKTIAICYCPECQIYLCNKCENSHSQSFSLHKINKINKLGEDLEQIFTGFCGNNEHKNKLEYFCKNHNILCCASCISKIDNNNFGQHSDCNICEIENIKEEKKDILKNNINSLEDLSKNVERSINELKNLFEKINEDKEELKIKIQILFTKIRNAINAREEELLLDIDKIYENNFNKQNIINEIDKLPDKIKISLDNANLNDKDWNDKNKLSFLINKCNIIENDIVEINKINQDIEAYKSEAKATFKFYPEGGYIIDKLFKKIMEFGKIYKINNNEENGNIIKDVNLDIEIRSVEKEPDDIMIKLNTFNSENYDNYIIENIDYENDEIVFTFCLEGKNENSADSLNEIFQDFKELAKNDIPSLDIKREKTKLYLFFKIKFNCFEYIQELYKTDINFFDFLNFSLRFNSNLELNRLLKMDEEKFFVNLLSFIFSIQANTNDLQNLVLQLDKANNTDFLNDIFNLIRLINSLQNIKIDFNFSPNKTLDMMKKNANDEDFIKSDLKELKEMYINEFLGSLPEDIIKEILKNLKNENLLVTIFFAKYKSGFILDINSNGLAEVINDFYSQNNFLDLNMKKNFE